MDSHPVTVRRLMRGVFGHGRRRLDRLPAHEARRRGGRLSRYQGRRPLPLARRRRAQVGRGRSLGGGPEQGDTSLLARSLRARAASETAHRPVELREVFRPDQSRGEILLHQERRLAKPECVLRAGFADGEARVLIDPNTWSKDGTVALAGMSVSDDGKYLAYGRAEAGSDWHTWKVLAIDTGKVLDDEIKWTKHSEAAWTKDGKGFFYSRFDEPKKDEQFQALNLNQKVFYHRIGASQSDDVLVYKRPDQPEWGFQSQVTEEGKYLVVSTYKGTDSRNRVTYKDLTEPYGMPVDLIDEFDNEYSLIDNDGPVFYFKTDLDAPRGRVIAIDIRKPEKANWKEIVPQAKDNLSSIGMVGNLFVADYLKDAHTETFYTFSSFATPPSIYHYDLVTGKSERFRQSKVKFKADDYVVEQVFYESKDGTKVPMFITHKKGIKLDGTNPTLLYGYGGFNISLTPGFSISRLQWMEMGGV